MKPVAEPEEQHRGVLKTIKRLPGKLFGDRSRTASVSAQDAPSYIRNNRAKKEVIATVNDHHKVSFAVQDSEGKSIVEYDDADGVHRSQSTLVRPRHFRAYSNVIPTAEITLRDRSRSFSNLPNQNKIEYNPYGIFNHHDVFSLGTAFGGNQRKDEPELRLVNPLTSPNQLLPYEYREEHDNLEEMYELVEHDIGSGGSATIKLLYLKTDLEKKNLFALKKFSLFHGEVQAKYYKRVLTEYLITKNLSNLHSVKCFDLLQLPLTLQSAWGMVMDFYEYDLYKLIKSPHWKSVPFEEKMCIFKQICFGLKYIHENDIAHLDIKPDNVLVARNGLMKITDYGCSEMGHIIHGDFGSKVALLDKRLGTPPYQPPEVSRYTLLDQESRVPFCPFKFDYWSLGILLYILISAKAPFTSSKLTDPAYKVYTMEYAKFGELNPLFSKDLTNKIPKGGIFSDAHGNDPNYIQLFWRLCDPNPTTRMTLPKLFKNSFFQKLNMCVNEMSYAVNFCRHEKSKEMHFEFPISSDEEFTLQKEIKHSMWDDLPTVDTSEYKYESLVGPHRPHNSFNEALPNDDIENLRNELTKRDDESTVGSSSCDISMKDQEISENDTAVSESSSKPNGSVILMNSVRTPVRYSLMGEDIRLPLFGRSDYANTNTEYMIVDVEDIIKSCHYTIREHSHNYMYNQKTKESSLSNFPRSALNL